MLIEFRCKFCHKTLFKYPDKPNWEFELDTKCSKCGTINKFVISRKGEFLSYTHIAEQSA